MSLVLGAWLGTGCVSYEERPIDPTGHAAVLEQRCLSDAGLKSFLETAGPHPVEPWPRETWTVQELTLAALYFHPALDVARARWKVAQAGQITAGARPNPTLGAGPQYNFSAADGVTPWLAFLDLDIPIETAGKRRYRIAEAGRLADSARWLVISTAWAIRAEVQGAMIEWQLAVDRIESLERQCRLAEELHLRSRQRHDAGAGSREELLIAERRLRQLRDALAEARVGQVECTSRLAKAVGVPPRSLAAVRVAAPELKEPPLTAEVSVVEARRIALNGRADAQALLAEYEAAQSALQLEIARQYPDLHLGPGYEYDQGENKFGFQLALELPLLNRNQGAIAAAEARRAEVAARFAELQTGIISEVESAMALTVATGTRLGELRALVTGYEAQIGLRKAQVAAGYTDRFELAMATLSAEEARYGFFEAIADAHRARLRLESAMQVSLGIDPTVSPGPRADEKETE